MNFIDVVHTTLHLENQPAVLGLGSFSVSTVAKAVSLHPLFETGFLGLETPRVLSPTCESELFLFERKFVNWCVPTVDALLTHLLTGIPLDWFHLQEVSLCLHPSLSQLLLPSVLCWQWF